jgi:hypothetical protein
MYNGSTTADEITGVFTQTMALNPLQLSLLHLRDPDAQGHGSNWETAAYSNAVVAVDGYIGSVLFLLENTAPFVGNSTLILTADHGGAGTVHQDEGDYKNYRIPFYVWGADVPEPGDLYSINFHSRLEPGLDRPNYYELVQPIRNGDCGNLALMLLDLPPVPDADAIINRKQDLKVSLEANYVGRPAISPKISGRGLEMCWNHLASPNRYTLQTRDNLDAFWKNAPGAVLTRRPYFVVPFDQVRAYFRVVITP